MTNFLRHSVRTLIATLFFAICSVADASRWTMHIIDNTSRGADGVKTGDLNADGLVDLVTAWEEGGVVRAYINPGKDKVKLPWPIVEIGEVADPEDAILFDGDGDGHLDVFVATELDNRQIYEFRKPETANLHSSVHWSRTMAHVTENRDFLSKVLCDWGLALLRIIGQEEGCYLRSRLQYWLYLAPVVLDGQSAFFAGSKLHYATVSLFKRTTDKRGNARWRGEPLTRAGWIMSLRVVDFDGDGDPDVLFSDRRGADLNGNGQLDDGIAWYERSRPVRGIFWLENTTGQWIKHVIHETDSEIMFFDIGDLDNDGDDDIVAAMQSNSVLLLQRRGRMEFTVREMKIPSEGKVYPKGVALADITGDGVDEIIMTVDGAIGDLPRVFFLTRNSVDAQDWELGDIGGPIGRKFDRIELLDLDQDGDFDVVTTEESDGLGVIWYENPLYTAVPTKL